MSILYLDCSSGIAGDMFSAALLALVPDKEACLQELNALGIPGVAFSCEKVQRNGVTGLHVQVSVNGVVEGEHDHGHAHSHSDEHHHLHAHHSLADISSVIDGLNASEAVREDAKAVFGLIAKAEASVHGEALDQIHFHEVGTMDAVADVVAVSWLMNQLAPEQVVASPVCTGFGTVHCAHGILPVPAPATSLLLEGVPIYAGTVEAELCTPTGAALLTYFTDEFSAMPLMVVQEVGYGMGAKELPQLNGVRALLGEEALEGVGGTPSYGGDTVIKLECTIDDATPESLGFALEELMAAGALDVYYIPVQMKKGRPGVLLTVITTAELEDTLVAAVFRTTPTLGMRRIVCDRYTLTRHEEIRKTPFGLVRLKHAEGFGVSRCKPEYEDVARIARETGYSVDEVRRLLM